MLHYCSMQYTTLTIRKESYEKLRKYAFKNRKSMAAILHDFATSLDRRGYPQAECKIALCVTVGNVQCTQIKAPATALTVSAWG